MVLRPASLDDLDALTAVFRAYDEVEMGSADMDAEDVRELFDEPTGVRVVEEIAGRLVGFAQVDGKGDLESVADPVEPDFRARQAELVSWCLDQARSLGLTEVQHWTGGRPDGAAALLQEAGFRHVRTSWRMRHSLGQDLLPPRWPADVGLRPFDRDRDSHEVWTLVQRGFAGTFGSRRRTLEEWQRIFLTPNADVLCAVEGGSIVGIAVVSPREEVGFIPQLVVAEEQRGRGIATALLHSAFARHAEVSKETTLNVDGENDRASRVYLQAGMQVESAFWQWGRAL